VLSAAKGRAQFCANPPFHPRDGASGCEKFSALLRVRCVGVGECVALQAQVAVRCSISSSRMTQSAYFKCFFFADHARLMVAVPSNGVFAVAREGAAAGAGRASGTWRM